MTAQAADASVGVAVRTSGVIANRGPSSRNLSRRNEGDSEQSPGHRRNPGLADNPDEPALESTGVLNVPRLTTSRRIEQFSGVLFKFWAACQYGGRKTPGFRRLRPTPDTER